MSSSKLTEGRIRQRATEKSFQRGMEYFEENSVSSVVQRGDTLHAEVAGSHYDPYRVQVRFENGEIADAYCDCPYDWGGWCKHIVAVLLAYIHAPEMIDHKAPIESILSDLNREQLLDLLLKLAELNPKLVDQIEGQLY